MDKKTYMEIGMLQAIAFRNHPGWSKGGHLPPSLHEIIEDLNLGWEKLCQPGLQEESPEQGSSATCSRAAAQQPQTHKTCKSPK